MSAFEAKQTKAMEATEATEAIVSHVYDDMGYDEYRGLMVGRFELDQIYEALALSPQSDRDDIDRAIAEYETRHLGDLAESRSGHRARLGREIETMMGPVKEARQ